MEKSCLFLLLAVLSNQALGFSFRNKRQADDSSTDKNLEDRYGWNRPNWLQIGQGGQGQGQFPGQWQGQFPGQWQGQFPGQWQNQLPGQGQEQLPGQGQEQLPGQGQGQQPGQGDSQTTTPSANGSTTLSSSVRECIRNCPVTSEYNPVCGSDGVTYTNPGRMGCAQACGVTVNLFRASRCPGSIQSN